MYTLEGVSSVANFITAYEESQNNRDSHCLSVMCSLFPKATFKIFIGSISRKTSEGLIYSQKCE